MDLVAQKDKVKQLVGKQVYAIKKDGTVVFGKLVRMKGNTLTIALQQKNMAKTSAFIPLVLFDLLAIGTLPFGFGGFGFGYPGYGYPDFFW